MLLKGMQEEQDPSTHSLNKLLIAVYHVTDKTQKQKVIFEN